jgi:hypothetical protein
VYLGNKHGEQVESFIAAMKNVKEYFRRHNIDVCLEMKALAEMRTAQMHFSDMITWLLGSHIHLIITHPHQGWESSHYQVTNIYEELNRLRYHTGYPSHDKLDCPIFRQDKWTYLTDLPEHMKLPTVMIPMFLDMDMTACEELISE